MKHLRQTFLLCLLWMIGTNLGVYAQGVEEDVTRYIKNAGFDEDITWNSDGSPKEIVDKSENLSKGRSQAWVAADNSVYCSALTSGNPNWKRTDVDFSWNGFIGQVAGWTLESNKSTSAPYKASSPEWVYFGTIPYDLGPRAVPIADDNNDSFLRVPATKPEGDNGDDNKAAIYLRAAWGGSAAYKQVIDLPCARYRLDYWVYNDNYNNSKGNTKVKNLCKVICRNDVFEDSQDFATQTWEKHSIEFTSTANFTIQFGFTADGGTNTNPFLYIDGIRLYKIGEADAEEITYNEIWYTASEKLNETTDQYSAGLHTNAFNATMTSHEFNNGKGIITFDANVTSVGNSAFYGCSSLTSIEIPNSVTSIGNYAFQDCM